MSKYVTIDRQGNFIKFENCKPKIAADLQDATVLDTLIHDTGLISIPVSVKEVISLTQNKGTGRWVCISSKGHFSNCNEGYTGKLQRAKVYNAEDRQLLLYDIFLSVYVTETITIGYGS